MSVAARLPVMRPLLPRAESVLPYLRRIDASRIYANRGPLVHELEARYAQFLGVDQGQVVTAPSATTGLIGAISVAPPTEWFVPDFAFPAPALAVLAAGASATLVDVSSTDWQMDIAKANFTPAAALLPVLPFGAPIEFDRWPASTVVVDAASSLGSSKDQLADLPSQWTVVYSLHATKVLAAGEGGLVVFGDAQRAERFRQWANFGFLDGGQSALQGQNAKMPEVSAAYALASLDSWPEEEQEWIDAQSLASTALSGMAGIRQRPGAVTPHPYWIVQFESPTQCDAVSKSLAESGIESRRWWGALHTMPAFAHCEHDGLSEADHLARTTLGLPMSRSLTQAEAESVRAAIMRAGIT